jgi:hypothetical protein
VARRSSSLAMVISCSTGLDRGEVRPGRVKGVVRWGSSKGRKAAAGQSLVSDKRQR